MVHLKNTSYSAREASELLQIARDLVSADVVILDVRVSKKYVELDVSTAEANFTPTLERLENISPLVSYERVIEKHMEDKVALSRAVDYFNEEKYWNAHEVLEQVWKRSSGKEKDLLNGLILIAAAFVHDEKDEKDICLSILERAMKKFQDSEGYYYNVDIDEIKSQVQNILQSGTVIRFTV
jgi:uncharacterized protein